MSEFRIIKTPTPQQLLRFREGAGQRFLLTVDTEEDFDWTSPLGRESHSLDSVAQLGKYQRFCEAHDVRPVYLVDYPVATSPVAAEMLGDALAAGRAEIGVQLHPWVNPPLEERLSDYNSFAGNLPFELERAKLLELHAAIIRNFGQAPAIYRAGRYGVGPNTGYILREAGIAIDSSVRARFDYRDIGGPSFAHLGAHPWWVSGQGSLIELPLTTVFCGVLRGHGEALYPALGRVERLRGAMARLKLLERIPLTPEGVTIAEAKRAIDAAIEDKLPILVLSFHSPSLRPGCTPYVRDEADLEGLYAWWEAIFEHLAAHGIASTSPREILESVELA